MIVLVLPGISVILLTLLAAHVVYQLFLSPLSRYPGPFWAKLSSLHNLYHAYHKDIHRDIKKQHERYGEEGDSGFTRALNRNV